MLFEWDEAKNGINRRKHKLSFETAKRIFEDPRTVYVFDRAVECEERWRAIGLVQGVLFLPDRGPHLPDARG